MKAREPAERVIKRYANRKLYDPKDRRHVTLGELARLVADGQEVRVLDQATGEDLTSAVLAQTILETIKQRTAEIPRHVLARIIRLSAGAPSATPPSAPAEVRVRDEAEKIVGRLLSRGSLGLEEALGLRQEIADALHALVKETQRGLEARLREVLDWSARGKAIAPALQSLRERLMTLDEYFTRPEAKKARPRKPRRTVRKAGRRRG